MGVLKLVLGFVVICWLGIAAFVYFTQGSLLYQPRPVDAMGETALMNSQPDLEVMLVVTPDGKTLAGWFLPRKKGRTLAPALVYYGGNAEDAMDFIRQAKDYPDMSIAAVNYRGFGRSTGVPGEAALKEDALRVFDEAVSRTGGRGFVMGRSLGSGLAAHVAAQREVMGAVLLTPYDSILAVAKDHYPFLPVSLLLKERWDALPDAAQARAEALVVTANQDDVIGEARSDAFYDAWGGSKQRVRVPLAGHNDITSFPVCNGAVQKFFRDRLQ
jgi:pimeloyl-ACP methyl ester carboxylesterase